MVEQGVALGTTKALEVTGCVRQRADDRWRELPRYQTPTDDCNAMCSVTDI
jgi:hypothetical protein